MYRQFDRGRDKNSLQGSPAIIQFYFITSDKEVFVWEDSRRLVEKFLKELKREYIGRVHRSIHVCRVPKVVFAIGQQPGHPHLPRFGVACKFLMSNYGMFACSLASQFCAGQTFQRYKLCVGTMHQVPGMSNSGMTRIPLILAASMISATSCWL